MAVFLFVMASMAVLAGLVSFVAGHVPRTTGRERATRAAEPARQQGSP
jgi:hypothetical protein